MLSPEIARIAQKFANFLCNFCSIATKVLEIALKVAAVSSSARTSSVALVCAHTREIRAWDSPPLPPAALSVGWGGTFLEVALDSI